jgi:hypothetical protein
VVAAMAVLVFYQPRLQGLAQPTTGQPPHLFGVFGEHVHQ